MQKKIRAKLTIAIARIKNLFKQTTRKTVTNPTMSMGIPGMATATGITMALGLPPTTAISMSLTACVLMLFSKIGPTYRPNVINIGNLDFEREFNTITKNL